VLNMLVLHTTDFEADEVAKNFRLTNLVKYVQHRRYSLIKQATIDSATLEFDSESRRLVAQENVIHSTDFF
jgi:hypothetical protein